MAKAQSPFLIVNPKSYLYGKESLELAKAADQVAKDTGLQIYFTCPYADIRMIKENLDKYAELTSLDPDTFVHGKGRRKTLYQRQYEKLINYIERLKTYAKYIEICGNDRNSYSKTDHSASFMRIKTDYIGNDQLLPAYNLQAAIYDEHIAVVDVKQYASDMEWKST